MKLLSYLLVLILLLSLCACGGAAPAAPSQNDPDTSSSSQAIDSIISSSDSLADPDPIVNPDPEPDPVEAPASSQPPSSSSVPPISNPPAAAEVPPELDPFEAVLKELGLAFTVTARYGPDIILRGAKCVRTYQIGDTECFTIYEFDMKSDAYSEIKETGKLIYRSIYGTFESPADARRQGFVLILTRQASSESKFDWKTGQPKSSTVITLDEEGIASSKDIIEAFINNVG